MSSASSTSPNVIRSIKLRGHQGSVLCLDHSSSSSSSSVIASDSLLLSGSEDRTCRLWDLRASQRASVCIRCPANNGGDILSVVFGPKWYEQQQHELKTEVETGTKPSQFAIDHSVFIAVGNNVYGYDLRKNASPIIQNSFQDLTDLQSTDEINQIVFSPPRLRHQRNSQNSRGSRGKNTVGGRSPSSSNIPAPCLATADDAGMIRIIDNACEHSSRGIRQRRTYCHGSEAMVTSIAFCPQIGSVSSRQSSSLLLASGGTDCHIHLWDVSKESSCAPLSSVHIPVNVTESGTNQLCNPPMVHSLHWSPSGKLLAAGLGDGSVALLQLHSLSRLALTSRLNDAHSGSVASCLFPEWTRTNNDNTGYSNSYNAATTAHDRLFCTAGNDGCIVFWDLGAVIGGDKATSPADILRLDLNTDLDGSSKINESIQPNEGLSERMQNTLNIEINQPETLYAFQHDSKPNWIMSSCGRDPLFPSALFVADTSHDITIYAIPLQ